MTVRDANWVGALAGNMLTHNCQHLPGYEEVCERTEIQQFHNRAQKRVQTVLGRLFAYETTVERWGCWWGSWLGNEYAYDP
ncbi:unnamed protein product, partial [Nesidiocoris tenuis]